MFYPATGTATDTLVLRAPEFGNKDRLQFNRISRETRGGTLIVYADPMWPKTQTLVLTFSALKPAQAEALWSSWRITWAWKSASGIGKDANGLASSPTPTTRWFKTASTAIRAPWSLKVNLSLREAIMFYLQAPYPTMQTMTVLPDPRFSDAMNLTDAVTVKRAMDGTRYTYIKTKGGRRKRSGSSN